MRNILASSSLLSAVAFSLLMIFSFSAFSQRKKDKDKDKLSYEQRMSFERMFYDAAKEKMMGNMDDALDKYYQCIKIDPNNAAAKYEAANILLKKHKLDEALLFAQDAVRLDENNVWYNQLLAEVYLNTGNTKDAIEIYETLTKKYPYRIEYYESWADALLMDNKINDAVKVYDKIEQQIGIDPDLIRAKMRIYLKQGKIDQAAAEVQKLINYDPSLQNYSMLVELYQANNMQDKAYEVIQKMQQIDPNSAYVAFALADYYRSKKENDKAFEQLKKAFAAKDASTELKLQVLTSYIPLISTNEQMQAQAMELAQILVENDPSNSQAHILYADFLFQDQKFELARDQYRLGLNSGKDNFVLWTQILDCDLKLSDNISLEKESNQAIELFPNQPGVFLYNGIAKMQLKKYDEATKSLLTGSKQVISNNPLLANFYSSLGECYNYMKSYEESDKYFDKALKLEPRNAVTLNNYSYYLSLRNENMEHAEAMSKLANQLNPDDATYEDTYAWVLYVMKRYDDAKLWLEKALQHGGDKNGTILEHYGDVLFKLNNVEQAVDYWKKAKAAGEASENIDKKIAERKLFE